MLITMIMIQNDQDVADDFFSPYRIKRIATISDDGDDDDE